MRDKREHQRAAVTIDVIVELPDGGTLSARTADVSQGGMFLVADSAPAYGAEVTVVCSLPRLEGARLPAVVRWNKPGGFGVQFGLLGARETHSLGQLMKGGAGPVSGRGE